MEDVWFVHDDFAEVLLAHAAGGGGKEVRSLVHLYRNGNPTFYRKPGRCRHVRIAWKWEVARCIARCAYLTTAVKEGLEQDLLSEERCWKSMMSEFNGTILRQYKGLFDRYEANFSKTISMELGLTKNIQELVSASCEWRTSCGQLHDLIQEIVAIGGNDLARATPCALS